MERRIRHKIKSRLTVTKKPTGKKKEIGELRQDIISGEWIVIATGRNRHPDDLTREHVKLKTYPKYKSDCPFCNLAKFPQEPDVIRLPDDPDDWQVHIFANKYPAFTPQDEFRTWNTGPYRAVNTVGYHDLLATRWHNQIDSNLTLKELTLIIEALILRYRQLRIRPSVNYIQIIKNHGPEAGGSLEHPHHQIFAIPVLPSDVLNLLRGAENYSAEHDQNVFTAMLDFERDSQTRLVWENNLFTAFCPYASRVPFEVWIMPRQPDPFFENIDHAQREALAEIMQQVLGRLYRGLNDPPYNYYIHSAPCDESGFVCNQQSFQHFRWHIQILPRLSTLFGGFELGTGLEINIVSPEEAARFLREVNLEPI